MLTQRHRPLTRSQAAKQAAVTRAETARREARSLRYWLGDIMGVRRSKAEMVASRNAFDRMTGAAAWDVEQAMGVAVCDGFAVKAPGPRGGAGWTLTPSGERMIRRRLDLPARESR
ncbi:MULTISPECIES: hypothetical protein [Methylopilaceae]|uniref:Uncharacterized protein n=2 Tax=Methylopilaceae TaxID=3149309 RepID=A0A4Q0MAV3_9HYPH|nr:MULTISPECIES: hypothetical protein [Methylocystaceae]QZO00599.1 hypothetical protein K6K41_02420 [Chenggangzhangella methanolivorans]RXF69939.1 hypothetical protein EK403_17550 [Hansschlegelia zhihuaiae]